MVKIETQEVFTTAINDVEADIMEKSNAYILSIAEDVKNEYERMLVEEDRDVIIAALILHDAFKHGKLYQKYTCADHPVIAYRMVREHMQDCPRYEDIANAIHSHMGKWNTDYRTKREIMPKPKTGIEKFVHTCDYLASRKYLEFKFDVEVDLR